MLAFVGVEGVVTLRDVLTAPFVLRSESVEDDTGTWVRVVSYPELGCSERGESLPELMERLEVRKLRWLVDRWTAGNVPAIRRAGPDPTLEWRLAQSGLAAWIARLDDEVRR